ncbi:hypothetical protein AB0G67_40335 [Streptomyces sp. NPDC021056]|uniref:hypothetical protein n=1 Tax=Streptomyces sp. NPDC021056 TaxID=3155012 RepID=UPI0033FF2F74
MTTRRKARTRMKKRITRILAGLTLTALAATGYALTDNLVATTHQDTGWGAPDTTGTTVATDAEISIDIDPGTITDTILGDSGWG